ncbi:T9SS type A sorting domain-containing protein [Bernardetia sp. Wsw4-3y2]|uniref:DUF7619 domain-containing protein n=1 Tax=Bernardetia sp. Wsw4-3y2 TaxID=3127471 RepID=UPI0030CCA67C
MTKSYSNLLSLLFVCAVFLLNNFYSFSVFGQCNLAENDASFNTSDTLSHGIAHTFGFSLADFTSLSDGKILVSGGIDQYHNRNVNGLIRLNEDGSIDDTFISISESEFPNVYISKILVQPDNKIIAFGDITDNAGVNRYALRFQEDGTLDNSFNTNFVFDRAITNDIDIQSDGKIIIAGNFYDGVNYQGLIRLNSDGSLDNTFQQGISSRIEDIAIDVNDKIVVGGNFNNYNGVSCSQNIVRLNSDGSLDTSFNNGNTGFNSFVYAIEIQNDNKIVVGGDFDTYNSIQANKIIRLNTDGSLDNSFNNSVANIEEIQEITIQANGKVLAIERKNLSGIGQNDPSQIIRFNSNGVRDNSFSTTGWYSMADRLQPLNSGKLLFISTRPGISIERLNNDGARDDSFGVFYGFDNYVTETKKTIDNKLFVLGAFGKYNNKRAYAIAKLNTNGTLDTTFSFTDNVDYSKIRCVTPQIDGKLLVGGRFSYSNNGLIRERLLRLNQNGSIDLNFNTNSIINTGLIDVIEVQNDGKIILAGDFLINAINSQGLVRLNVDGSVDNSFTTIGINNGGRIYAIEVCLDGKIILTGQFETYNGVSVNNIVRILPNGSIDPTFASNLNIPYSYRSYTQSNGDILVGGRAKLYKMNSQGLVDTNFNIDVTTSTGTGYIGNFVVQSNGQIVVVGEFDQINGFSTINIAKINTDGTVNTGFYSNNNTDGVIRNVTLQSNNSLIITGSFMNYDGMSRNRIAKINNNDTFEAVSKSNYKVYLDNAGQVELNAALLDSASSVNCGNTIASFIFDDTGLATRSFSCTNIGTSQNVVLRVTDNQGNTETSPTIIHVKDTIRPVVVTRILPVTFNASNQATILARDFVTSLSDNCTDSANISVVFNDTGMESKTFNCGNISLTNISLRITDQSGNQIIQPVIISPSSTYYDFNVNIFANTFRPAIASSITVLANNYSCAPQSGELKVTLPATVTYNSASITPDRIVGNNLFWDVTDLNFDRNFVVRVSVTPDISLNIGDEVCFSGHITPEANDLTRLNNLKQYCFPIVNSYDPNDKQVYPQGICDDKFTKRSDLPLTYTIRFQNTGNAPALNVNIVDSLSNLLDRSSLRVVGSSHPMVVDTTANNNVINFRFDDINLPDSTSSPALSQGYVIFELDEIAAHTDTSRIENKSYIYFDTNAPIITNTVKNTILDVLPLCDPAGGSNPPIADCQLPTNLTAEALSATRVKLSWATPANSNAINYEIWRNSQLLETVVASQLSFIDSLVSSSTQYTYSIKAICGNNTATTNFVQVRTIPSTPTLFSLEAACKGESGIIEVRSSGAVYRVYASQDATTPLFETSNATIQTPALNDTTTFYISVIINSLESERLEVVVPIKEVFEAIVEQGSLFESCTNTFTLSANEVENASYLWFRDNIQVGNTRALVVSFEGNYTVRISKEGCFAVSEATKVVFVDAPTAKIEQGSEVPFCGNGMLNAQDTSSNVTYTWSLNGTDIGTGTSISVSESGNYTLTASQPSCLDSVSIAVTITDLSVVVLSADKTEICLSEETTLSVTTGTGFTYKWFRNDTAISNDSSTLVTSEIGTYKVEITTAEGCQVESNEIEITEAQAQNATITINKENSFDKTITVSSSDSIVSVVWFKDGTEVASFANQRTIEPTESGNYKAKVTYISGCEFETEEKVFTFDIETGIEEESAKIFTVYPNPNTGTFKVEFATTTNQKTNLVLVDALGRTIYSKEISRNEKTTTITLPRISAGVYVVQIVSQGKVYTKQLVIQ